MQKYSAFQEKNYYPRVLSCVKMAFSPKSYENSLHENKISKTPYLSFKLILASFTKRLQGNIHFFLTSHVSKNSENCDPCSSCSNHTEEGQSNITYFIKFIYCISSRKVCEIFLVAILLQVFFSTNRTFQSCISNPSNF